MEKLDNPAFITNDAVIFGILMLILATVFYTSGKKQGLWVKFYRYVPSVLICYFVPALLNTFDIISGVHSGLYDMAANYLLPACLVLLTLGIDIPGLKRLGPKAISIFFAGTVGIMIGGPIAFAFIARIFPDILLFGEEPTWKGFATIAGSWIGGGANQAALLEVFGASKTLFAQMIAVDVLIANIWLGVLLYSVQHRDAINRFLKADNSEIKALEQKLEIEAEKRNAKTIGLREWTITLGLAFGAVALSHACADLLVPFFTTYFPGAAKYSLTSNFFWVVITATTLGILLSFTKARQLENSGASDMGSLFLYILVATIGMNMNLRAVLDNPKFFLVGALWILIHITIMLIAGRIFKAPLFLIAVGSQANVGGAATAPIVASAFNKFLAPVGVLLAVLGYALGTYGGYLCGLFLQWISDTLLY